LRKITADWMRKWNFLKVSANPPFRERIPAALDYLRRLETEPAYVAPQGNTESHKAYKRHIYDTMPSIHRVPAGNEEMRITRHWPQANWKQYGRTWVKSR
jgi:hypothetical protein